MCKILCLVQKYILIFIQSCMKKEKKSKKLSKNLNAALSLFKSKSIRTFIYFWWEIENQLVKLFLSLNTDYMNKRK